MMRLWKAPAPPRPRENCSLRLIFLAASSLKILVDDVADVLEVDGEGDDLHGAVALALVEAAARQLGHVELDGLVELVDDVVHARDFARPARGRWSSAPS